MTVSRRRKNRRVKKTDEQMEAGKKLGAFFEENKIKDGDEISRAVFRLMRLNFTGWSELTLKMVHDKLPVAFDKYIERGFHLTEKEKNFMRENKETIISFLKPFYWEEDNAVFGVKYKMRMPDYIDGFNGFFNLGDDDFV